MSTLGCLYLSIYPPFGDLFIFKFKLISGRLAGSFQGRIKMFPSILPLHGEANSHRRPPTLLHSHSVLFIYASEEQWLRKQGDAASTTHIRKRQGLKQATRPPSQGRVCRVWLHAGQTGLWITTALPEQSLLCWVITLNYKYGHHCMWLVIPLLRTHLKSSNVWGKSHT